MIAEHQEVLHNLELEGWKQFLTLQFRRIDVPRSFRGGSNNGAAILEKPVSDRGTLEDSSQSPILPSARP